MGVVDDRIQVPCAFFRAPELGLREADSAVDAVAVGGAGGPGPGRAELPRWPAPGSCAAADASRASCTMRRISCATTANRLFTIEGVAGSESAALQE